jgi:hypothetical protein
MRAGTGPIVVEDGVRIPAQLLSLVERELEARIEAKMARRYRQRRRAAKEARRLASLPTALLQCEAVEEQPEPEVWTPQPTYVSPIIVDLPAAAVREVRSIAAVAELTVVPAEPVTMDAVEEIVIVAEAPVDEVVLIAEEPVVERPLSAPRSRPRRRAPEAPHHREPRPEAEVETDIDRAPEPVAEVPVAEVPVVEVPVVEVPVVEVPVVEVPVVEVPVVEVPVVEVPVVEVPVVELPEEPELAEQPEVDPVPVATRAWQPSNPVWRERVFNSAHTRRETVTWPRPRPANGDFRGR